MIFPFEYEHDSWIICRSLVTHGICAVHAVCVSVGRRCWSCYGRLLAPIQKIDYSPGRARERWHCSSSIVYVCMCVAYYWLASCSSVYIMCMDIIIDVIRSVVTCSSYQCVSECERVVPMSLILRSTVSVGECLLT
jgi:hypothetical protein